MFPIKYFCVSLVFILSGWTQEFIGAVSIEEKLNQLVYSFHNKVDRQSSFENERTLELVQFSWKSCGQPSYPSHIDDISLQPDPLKLPGSVTIGFKGELNVSLHAPLRMIVEVQKKVIVWIKVPCIDNVGSCTYDDVCKFIPLLKCPVVFQKYGIPCACPIPANTYKLPPSPFYIDDSFLPSFLTDGEYQVKADISQGSRSIVCIHMEFHIA
jgi:ganglioside GM2 activator